MDLGRDPALDFLKGLKNRMTIPFSASTVSVMANSVVSSSVASNSVASEAAATADPPRLPHRSKRAALKELLFGSKGSAGTTDEESASATAPVAAEPVVEDLPTMIQVTMTKHNKDVQGMDRTYLLNQKILAVNEGLMQNIQKLIDRGGAIEDLVTQCEELSNNASALRSTTQQALRQARCSHRKVKLSVFLAVLCVILVEMFSMCGITLEDC